jgi:hypothetical protein
MQRVVQRLGAVVLVLAVAACGNSSGPNPPPTLTINCTSAPITALAAVGDFAILDASQNSGCARLPLAGPSGAEHLLIALSASKTNDWTEGYNFRGKSLGAAPAPQPMAALPSPRLAAFSQPLNSLAFHQMLREQEHILAASPQAHLFAAAPLAAPVPPVLNSQRSFWVCKTTSCSGFISVTATAKYVGTRGAIYLDNAAPDSTVGGYTQEEIDTLGALFDGAPPNMYAIDTTAFGRESDRDGNGVVIILLTSALNKLSPNCNTTQQVILGYFYGADLVNGAPGSNNGEVFYSLVPDPNSTATTNCTIPKWYAKTYLPPTFIHEFQHMISWNQHVILGGAADEDTWLNEGLSHFAQELGGRVLPDDGRFGGEFSTGQPMDRFTQFAGDNYLNAFSYLQNPEAAFLVYNASQGTLKERGAGWLFVRWLADHFGTDALGNGLTQPLVETTRRGANNVEFVTGVAFDTLDTQWQMANYLESLPAVIPAEARLGSINGNLLANFTAIGGGYPLVPAMTSGSYSRSAILRAGSGRHVRLIQAANAAAVDFQLSTQTGNPLSATTAGRIGVVRIQ